MSAFKFCVLVAIGSLVNLSSAIEVSCIDKLIKRISIFKAEENHTNPYRDVIFDIRDTECFIEHPITLDENETLTITSENSERITSITFAALSTLPEFPLVIFTTFPNARDVHLISTGIEVIEEDDFVNATALKRLRLVQNNITRISKTAFAQALNLELLELPANGIHEIDDYAFSTLRNLTKLDLQQNNLTVIREHTFSGAHNLDEIYLNDNQIIVVEEGALYLEKLTRIYLQDNRLKTLSVDVLTGAPSLYGIELSRNELESVQGIFDKCPNLTIIGLNHNRIKTIDWAELANIQSLRILSLEGNRIEFHSNANESTRIDQLSLKTHLEYLNLDSNNLSSPALLSELSVFHRLKFLDLDDNKLTKIDGFEKIRTLFPRFIQINLNNNPLSCAWLGNVSTVIEIENLLLKTDEDSEEDTGDKKLFGGNQRQINNITCNIEDPPSFHFEETAVRTGQLYV